MTRPRLPQDLKRNVKIGFNVNQNEKDILDNFFHKSQYSFFGDMLRERILNNSESESCIEIETEIERLKEENNQLQKEKNLNEELLKVFKEMYSLFLALNPKIREALQSNEEELRGFAKEYLALTKEKIKNKELITKYGGS